MEFEIRNKPDYASLHITLDTGEAIQTETGAMMGMSPKLKMETNMKGGLMGGLSRMVGGESVFQNTYTGTADGQRLDLAPSSPGDMGLLLEGPNDTAPYKVICCSSSYHCY